MNNKSLSILLGSVMIASMGNAAYSAPQMRGQDSKPLSRMKKANPKQCWSEPVTTGQNKFKVSPHFSVPASDQILYLDGPDGSQWYASTSYDTKTVELEGGEYTEKVLTGYTVTVYDAEFKEVGSIHDNIVLENGETRCAQAEISTTVTQKFFNNDEAYEVMMSMSMNNPDYSITSRTKVYKLEKGGGDTLSTPIAVLPGYPVDAVDCAKDKWSEDFYITFLTEEMGDLDKDYADYLEFLADYKQVLTTYSKAGYGGEPKILHEHKIAMLNLPGDQMNSPMMLSKNVGGKITLTYAEYEKSFYVDPTGQGGNEDITPDNNLIIDVYQMSDGYPKTLEHISSTKIATTQHTDNSDVYCTYYGIGIFSWDNDVDFTHFGKDGQPAFIITVDDYLFSDDEHYNSSYYVYDTEGNRIKTIAENTFTYVWLSDIAGYEPQVMFVHSGEDITFEFVDVYSGEKVLDLDQQYRGHALTTSIDRVPTPDGYVYVSALNAGLPDEDGESILAPVIWIDRDGEMIRLDCIPTGKNVELAQIYISSYALTPYIFNTDDDLEYMLLVKRRKSDTSNELQEELMISSVEKGTLYSFIPDEEKGTLKMVYLQDGVNPELIITYVNDYKYTADTYALPFTKFEGGKGTVADPYQIATAGDLQQISRDPNACYKLVSDIDCSQLQYKTISDFKGSLDGDGHVISNLAIRSSGESKTALFGYATDATIKNLDFYNCSMYLEGASEAGLIAGTATRTIFENIHVRKLTVNGDNYRETFGGLAGRGWLNTKFTSCEVTGADIDLPSCPTAGGIVGEIRTSTAITACAFTGKIFADNTIGGIVGSTTSGDETITFCHVDAALKGKNTVGGIAGFLKRSKVKSNYVEGTIEVTEPSKWTNALSAGAIAGELEGDWEKKADVPVVNNLIGVSAITYPELNIQEKYPHQLETVHRVVGRSSFNCEPEGIYDNDGNLIGYKDEVKYEEGIYNNLVVSDLAVIDKNFDERSIEGTSTDKETIDPEMLKASLGFEYGSTAASPWNLQSWHAYDPSLYYENIVYLPTSVLNVEKGAIFNIDIAILSREALSEEDILGDLMCEYNEEILEMTGNMSFDGHVLGIEFKALNEGATPFKISILDGSANCMVNVSPAIGTSVEGISSESGNLTYDGSETIAAGCTISVYDMNGRLILSGIDRVSTVALESGVYVAVATASNGNKDALKFVK